MQESYVLDKFWDKCTIYWVSKHEQRLHLTLLKQNMLYLHYHVSFAAYDDAHDDDTYDDDAYDDDAYDDDAYDDDAYDDDAYDNV